MNYKWIVWIEHHFMTPVLWVSFSPLNTCAQPDKTRQNAALRALTDVAEICAFDLRPKIKSAHMWKVSRVGPTTLILTILRSLSFSCCFHPGLWVPHKQVVHTWILFLASSRWWMSLGQSCMTVVSCLSWQSRYFSPASMYSLHSWVWRLTTPALPRPRTRPSPLPFLASALPDSVGPRSNSTGSRRSGRRRTVVARGRMVDRASFREKNQGDLGSDSCQRVVTGRRRPMVTAGSGRKKRGWREEKGERRLSFKGLC